MVKYFYWLFILAFLLTFYVWQQTQPVRLGYQAGSIKAECDKWDQENRDLRLKINNLLSLERLDTVAKQKNLAVPDKNSVIYLPK